jgi:hypothetical protein
MEKIAFTLVLFVLSWAVLAVTPQPDATATCTMDDKTHVAKYSCPDGYEVVYSGEGTKTCDGSCFKKGDPQSLQDAISRMVLTKWGKQYVPDSAALSRLSRDLLREKKATLSRADKGELQFKLDSSARNEQ